MLVALSSGIEVDAVRYFYQPAIVESVVIKMQLGWVYNSVGKSLVEHTSLLYTSHLKQVEMTYDTFDRQLYFPLMMLSSGL